MDLVVRETFELRNPVADILSMWIAFLRLCHGVVAGVVRLGVSSSSSTLWSYSSKRENTLEY